MATDHERLHPGFVPPYHRTFGESGEVALYESQANRKLSDYCVFMNPEDLCEATQKDLEKAMIYLFAYTSHHWQPLSCERYHEVALNAVEAGLVPAQFGNWKLVGAHSTDEEHFWTELHPVDESDNRIIIDPTGLDLSGSHRIDLLNYEPYFGHIDFAPRVLAESYSKPIFCEPEK